MYDIQQEQRHPLLSVVIPYYNPGPYFALAIKSVFAQTVSNWELILIDDGSTDGSQAIAAGIRDERVRQVSDGVNLGVNYRHNQGTRLANGEYIFLMDADDIMHPERLEKQAEALCDAPRNTVVGTACISIDANSQVIGMRRAQLRKEIGYRARHSFHQPSVAASRSWFLANPYSEEPIYRRAQDAELWCRTSPHSEFRWIQRPLQFYREMGVFSLPNYLATGRALIHLFKQIENNPIRSSLLIARERAKMEIARVLFNLKMSDTLVRNRIDRMSLDERSEAERALKRVFNTEIPLG